MCRGEREGRERERERIETCVVGGEALSNVLVCSGAVIAPVQCNDYEIRYLCQCSGELCVRDRGRGGVRGRKIETFVNGGEGFINFSCVVVLTSLLSNATIMRSGISIIDLVSSVFGVGAGRGAVEKNRNVWLGRGRAEQHFGV